MVIQTSSPELTKRIHEAIAEELRKLTPRVYCHVCELPLRVTSNSVSGIDLTSNIIVEPCNCCKEEKPAEESSISDLIFDLISAPNSEEFEIAWQTTDHYYVFSSKLDYNLMVIDKQTGGSKIEEDGYQGSYEGSREIRENIYKNILIPAGFVWSAPEDGSWGFRMDSKNLYLYRRGTRRTAGTLHLKEGCEFLAIGQNDKYFWPCDEDGLTSTEEQWKGVRNLFSDIMAKQGLGLYIPIWW